MTTANKHQYRLNRLLLIDGALVQGQGTEIAVENPATENIIARVPSASPEQIDAAVLSAQRTLTDSNWTDPTFRSASIDGIADLLEQHEDELVSIIVDEVGTPISTAQSLHVKIAVAHLQHAAKATIIDRTRDLGNHRDPVRSRSIIAYRPVGVVAAIAAYNYPLLISVAKLANAWAAGCTTVLLPSAQAPLSVLRFAELAAASSLPSGVLNVVLGDAEIGQALTSHPHIDKVSFTGSVQTGRAVMMQAAHNITGVTLELGGKSAAILLPGSDYAAITKAVHSRYLRNAGQGCGSPTRILVERTRMEEFIEHSRKAFDQFEVGDPWSPSVLVGPLISGSHKKRVQSYITTALQNGAEILAGGGECQIPVGHYMNPTLIGGVTNQDPIAREELFGPVAVLLPYDDIEEALAIANDSQLGLTASLFGPVEIARKLASRLRVGTVTINGGGGLRPDAPLCGYNDSGIGAEGGEDGIREFLRPQHIQWPE